MRRVIGSLLVAAALLLTACGGTQAPAQTTGGSGQTQQTGSTGTQQGQQTQGQQPPAGASSAGQADTGQSDGDTGQATEQSNGTTQPVSNEQAAAVEWNKDDPYAMTNGNPQTAVQLLGNESAKSLKQKAKAVKPGDLMKAVWRHYGKVVKLSGVVNFVEDYPPGDEVARSFGIEGESSEIHFVTDDGTLVIYLHVAGSSGDISEGDTVTVYGYPVGKHEDVNVMGGMTQGVVVFGKAVDKH